MQIEQLESRTLLTALPPAADFVDTVTNPYMPLLPGTTWIFKGMQDGKAAKNIVSVTHQTKTIIGIQATVVRDRVYLKGKLAEDTFDWYAQDRSGNVWYMGEDSKELGANGQVISTEGSWQSGVNGAAPGVIMEAHPKAGDRYRQEFAEAANDRAIVMNTNTSVTVPFGSFTHVLQTKEYSKLERGVIEQKFYVRGIGFVSSVMTKGGSEFFNLVAIRY